jgi:hypothetical protein
MLTLSMIALPLFIKWINTTSHSRDTHHVLQGSYFVGSLQEVRKAVEDVRGFTC